MGPAPGRGLCGGCKAAGLTLRETRAMPANNLMLLLRKGLTGPGGGQFLLFVEPVDQLADRQQAVER